MAATAAALRSQPERQRVFNSISLDFTATAIRSTTSGSTMPMPPRCRSATGALGGWGHDGLLKSPHVKETARRGRCRPSPSADGQRPRGGRNRRQLHAARQAQERRRVDLILKNGRLQTLIDPSICSTRPRSTSPASAVIASTFRPRSTITTTCRPRGCGPLRQGVEDQGRRHDLQGAQAVRVGDLRGNFGFQVVDQKQDPRARGSTS